ncbi:MAG TPA: hypothetical protein VLH85_07010 [Levilinea sp.]|nr:hypothetical protein [Levilinea sp.]
MIDLFTVFAQIVNFLLLIVLLKRFLYKPILKAIAAREERVANTVREADRAKAEAQQQIEAYRQKNEAWDAERAALVQALRQELDQQRKELTSEAHHDVEVARQHWHKGLRQEKQSFLHRLRQQVSYQTYQVARQVLADLADVDLELRIIQVFLKRLETIDYQQLVTLVQSMERGNGSLQVTSAFELSQENRLSIEKALDNRLVELYPSFSANRVLKFEFSSHVLYGIELRTSNFKLSWNMGDYLQMLEDALNEQLAVTVEE